MNGVKFDDKHSIIDWDLLMVSKSIPLPEPKTISVDIPGRDGKIYLSNAFGEIKYENRTLTFDFDIFSNPSKWWELREKIAQTLYDKKIKIILDQDPNYYYFGRCKITSFTTTFTVAHISIECDCEPFKYKLTETSISNNLVAGETYIFSNLDKSVIPIFELSDETTIEFEGNSYSLSAGTHKVLDIIFKRGNNYIKIISGTGTMKLTYQEATL